MKRQGWLWFVLLGIFYLSLFALAWTYSLRSEAVARLHEGDNTNAEFQGNDWVVWEDTQEGVFAKSVHPILRYKSLGITTTGDPINDIRPGDRLLQIQYSIDVYEAETVDQFTSNKQPGSSSTYKIDRYENNILTRKNPTVLNFFRLPFAFNEIGIYWQIFVWISGIGTFMALTMLSLLLPIIRGNYSSYLSLLGAVMGAILFFAIQFIHHLYLIVESNLDSLGFEKIFIISFVALLFFYLINYFVFKSGARNFLFAIPSLLVGAYLLYDFVNIIFYQKQLKFYHDLIEYNTYVFFLIHLLGGLVLFFADVSQTRRLEVLSLRNLLVLGLMSLLTILGLWYYTLGYSSFPNWNEHMLAIVSMLMFFPLLNSALPQSQFGKVSVVVTRSIQYLVFFIFSIALYLLINQLFSYLLPNNRYQRILEFMTFLVTLVTLRLIYQANENKFNRYVISQQQEKTQKTPGIHCQNSPVYFLPHVEKRAGQRASGLFSGQ